MQNTELPEFSIALLFIVGALLFVLIATILSSLVRPSRPNEEKLAPYECGEDAIGSPWPQFNIRFYIIALIFLLFEVEIVFLFPWAVVFGNSELIEGTDGLWGWFSLFEVGIFAAILALGLAYAWAKGYLDWVQPEQEANTFKSKVPARLYEELNEKYK